MSTGVAAARTVSGQAVEAVRSAFVHGQDMMLLVGAGIALVGAIVALFYRPATPEPDAARQPAVARG